MEQGAKGSRRVEKFFHGPYSKVVIFSHARYSALQVRSDYEETLFRSLYL